MQHGEPRAVADLIRAACAHQPLLLLCDFDGTLCEFRPDPAAVWLSTARRDLLKRLSVAPRSAVGIVSGRRLADVRLRSGLSSARVFMAGLHGLEIEGDGERFVHPEIGAARARARQVAAALAPMVAAIPGAFVEDKDLSIALHFREASPGDRAAIAPIFDRAIAQDLSAGHIRVMRGDSVLEVLPNIDWNKGNAVDWIRQRVARREPSPFTVYLGDDVTDEDAFHAVNGYGLRIAASDRVAGADYLVDGPAAVEQILEGLSR